MTQDNTEHDGLQGPWPNGDRFRFLDRGTDVELQEADAHEFAYARYEDADHPPRKPNPARRWRARDYL